jgi:hypothetical protein
MSTLSLDNVLSHVSIISLDDVASPISFADVPSYLSPLDDVSSHCDLSLSFDNVSFDDVFDDESAFYEVSSSMIFLDFHQLMFGSIARLSGHSTVSYR